MFYNKNVLIDNFKQKILNLLEFLNYHEEQQFEILHKSKDYSIISVVFYLSEKEVKNILQKILYFNKFSGKIELQNVSKELWAITFYKI